MRSRPVNQRRSPFRYGATQSPPACALLLLLAVALAFACGPARAGVPHYDLTVELEPAGRVLRVAGSITIPAGDTAVLELDDRFYLHEFEVDGGTAVEVGARPGGRKRWSVDASAGRSTEIRLRYAGRLNPLDTTLDHREVLGIAAAVSGADGAYLAAGSAWYPEPQGDGLTYRLAVTVPDGFRAVAPGRLVQEAGTRDGRVSVFESRVRLGGIDLIAGPYTVQSRSLALPSGREIAVRTYFHPELADLAAGYLESAGQHLARYDREIGPYAFEAYSIVSSPLPTGFGMPGLAYLGRKVLRLPFIRATSLRHEILHDWWGNGVAPDAAQGNWAEGLTTLLADHAYRQEQGAAQARAMRQGWLRDFAAVPPALDRPLASFRSRRHGADQAVGYNKTAFVFFMLRDLVADEAFRAALRRIWRDHRLGVAGWQALRQAFEAEAGVDLRAYFTQWVERPGAPQLAIADARRSAGPLGHRLTFVLHQRGTPYRLRVPLRVGHEQGTSTFDIDIAAKTERVELTLAAPPLWIEIDPDVRLFRRLDPEEIAPTLRETMIDPRTQVALADSEEGARAAALQVARAVLESDVRVVDHGNGVDTPVLIIGLHAAVERLLARWSLPVKSVPGAEPAAAYAYAGRTHAGRPFAVVSAPDAGALAALARPLPHLGAQSYAVFVGARSTVRGLWPAPARRYPVRD